MESCTGTPDGVMFIFAVPALKVMADVDPDEVGSRTAIDRMMANAFITLPLASPVKRSLIGEIALSEYYLIKEGTTTNRYGKIDIYNATRLVS
jgi:hypothetical protein